MHSALITLPAVRVFPPFLCRFYFFPDIFFSNSHGTRFFSSPLRNYARKTPPSPDFQPSPHGSWSWAFDSHPGWRLGVDNPEAGIGEVNRRVPVPLLFGHVEPQIPSARPRVADRVIIVCAETTGKRWRLVGGECLLAHFASYGLRA